MAVGGLFWLQVPARCPHFPRVGGPAPPDGELFEQRRGETYF